MHTLMIAGAQIALVVALTAAPALAQDPGPEVSKPETSIALAAVAAKAEANAKTACRGAEAKAGRCGSKTRKTTSKARVATPMITQCRDVISHQLTRCGGPNAEPVPAN